MAGEIRVLIADDHEIVRRGLRLFLDLQEGLLVVGEARDGAEAAVLAETGDERVIPALRAGADGYLTKDSGAEELAEARAVHRGEPVFCPEAVRRVARELVRTSTRPTGTVTVVFTDIEGSTEVLERLGEEGARKLFLDHDALVRPFVEQHGGTEVEKEGDSFMLAFAGARPAVECACAIQRALADHPLRVRMGLNTGDVVAEEDRYFGRTVYLAARVSAFAQGGEILVSDLTRALVGDLPRVSFADRGEHALKGLVGRHRLWEVEWRT